MKIAGRKTIEDWNELTKKLNINDNENWDNAFEFFNQRIITRYLNPIDSILKSKINLGEGFAVVNLQCSMIETIESFINGCASTFNKTKRRTEWKRKDDIIFNSNKEIFISFFNKREPFKNYKNKIDGGDFYENVRCSLLHETQTKGNWKIKTDIFNNKETYLEKDINKILYRENLHEDIKTLITKYKEAVINYQDFNEFSNETLKENFILKFNYICSKS